MSKGSASNETEWFSSAPPATPQLAKEYIYAGSRLLAVEDANANAAPPADLAVWRPSSGTWYVLGGTGSAQTYFQWGMSGDTAAPGDFDGDGKTDFSVYRVSTGVWWVTRSSDGSYYSQAFGASCSPPTGCDKPAPADFDGDGKTDPAVFRPDTATNYGTWYINNSSTGQATIQQFGLATDVPAPADYDGDGRADIAVWRDSNQTFYSINSGNSQSASSNFANFVTSGTVATPVSSDYDGDGKADYAVRNAANWIILNSATSVTSVTSWQLASDTPVPNDYDGDGRCDIAVWRPTDTPTGTLGHWFIRQSATGNSLRQVAWGTTGDIPVPAFYRR